MSSSGRAVLMHAAVVLLGLLIPAISVASDLTANAASPGLPTIALARQLDGRWTVRYTLATPVKRLFFARPDARHTRVRDWISQDSAFQLVVENGVEVVRRRDGMAFREAAFAMWPRYVQLEKDYAPFSPFGDGGLLLHTGRFHACPDDCAAIVSPRWNVKLTPPAGQHAIAVGRVVDRVEIVDVENGTNLYVGSAMPVETPDVVAVIDSTMPAGIRKRMETLLPRLMALYSAQLGALPAKPMLFASHDASHPGGNYGYQGGTLPGQVFMHIYGNNPAFDTPGFAEQMDAFFAHEAAHLFQRYPDSSDADAWIHEGGADALAAVALRQLGESEPGALSARLAAARSDCAASLQAGPLADAGGRGDFDAYYRCGFVLQMAVDAAANRASNQRCGLFCVWRDFQWRVHEGAPWAGATFIAASRSLGGAQVANFLAEVVDGKVDSAATRLALGMEAAGLPAASSAN